jgi:hypothetical protein
MPSACSVGFTHPTNAHLFSDLSNDGRRMLSLWSGPGEGIVQGGGQAAGFSGVDGECAVGVSGHEAEMLGRIADDRHFVAAGPGRLGQDKRMIDGASWTDCFLGINTIYRIHLQVLPRLAEWGKTGNRRKRGIREYERSRHPG